MTTTMRTLSDSRPERARRLLALLEAATSDRERQQLVELTLIHTETLGRETAAKGTRNNGHA